MLGQGAQCVGVRGSMAESPPLWLHKLLSAWILSLPVCSRYSMLWGWHMKPCACQATLRPHLHSILVPAVLRPSGGSTWSLPATAVGIASGVSVLVKHGTANLAPLSYHILLQPQHKDNPGARFVQWEFHSLSGFAL